MRRIGRHAHLRSIRLKAGRLIYIIQYIDGTFMAADPNVLFTPYAAYALQFSQEKADAIVLRNPRYRKLLVVTGNFSGYDGRPVRISNWRAVA